MKVFAKRIICALLAVLVCLLAVITSAYGHTVALASGHTNLDDTDVMDDLKGSLIGGKAFDVKDYGFNALLSTTVLYLAEYGYSYDPERQGDYNLYVYVWNPRGLRFADSEQNQVEFSYNGVNDTEYVKKPLELLSVLSRQNYERLFYKFKIVLTATEKTLMLRRLGSSERVYHIVGLEIMQAGDSEPTDYPINKVYRYSGYAKGYGADPETDSLRYTSTFGDVLDIERQGGLHQTFFRPQVNDALDGTTQDTLQSVYFSIPNKYFEDGYCLGAVRMEWLKAQTAWGLVTGNQSVYNALSPWIGVATNGSYSNGDRLQTYKNERGGGLPTPYAFGSALGSYNHYAHATDGIPYLAYLFPTDDWSTDSADDYVLSWEDMLDYMRNYHDRYDAADKTYFDANYAWSVPYGQAARYGCDVDYSRPYGGEYLKVDGVTYNFSRALFMSCMDEKTVMDIVSDNQYSLMSRKVDDSWWTKLWNNGEAVKKYTTRYDGIDAIYPVTKEDIKSTEAATCEALYIDRGDYAEFKAFYDRSVLLDETVVLVRYDVGNYVAAEATEGLPRNSGLVTGYDEGDTNARVFSMSAYLGLDVIHLEFDNGEEEFFLPCVSTPIVAGSDGTAAAGTHSDGCRGFGWRQILALILSIAILVLLLPVLPYIVKGIVWLITTPFKLISSGIKNLRSKKDKRKKG